jgi:hypothetical protein
VAGRRFGTADVPPRILQGHLNSSATWDRLERHGTDLRQLAEAEVFIEELEYPPLPSRANRAGREFEDAVEASAADLKFLHHLQQTLSGTSNRKAALKS